MRLRRPRGEGRPRHRRLLFLQRTAKMWAPSTMSGITRNEEVHSHAPVLFADHLHGAISEGGWCQESGNAPDSTDLSSGKIALRPARPVGGGPFADGL